MDNEVRIVNGSVVGVHLGAPMQDATPDKPEDNEQYATEANTVTRIPNGMESWDDQPKAGGGGGTSEPDLILTVKSRVGDYLSAENVELVTVTSGSMEAVRQAIISGRIPTAKVIFHDSVYATSYGVYGMIAECPATIYAYGGYIYLGCVNYFPLDLQVFWYKFVFDDTGTVVNITTGYTQLD